VARRIEALPGAVPINQLTVNEYAPGVGISPHVGEQSKTAKSCREPQLCQRVLLLLESVSVLACRSIERLVVGVQCLPASPQKPTQPSPVPLHRSAWQGRQLWCCARKGSGHGRCFCRLAPSCCSQVRGRAGKSGREPAQRCLEIWGCCLPSQCAADLV
jgi:hypothetical protein